MVVAAGDSHTTSYAALGALGFGIGTSDIEHYLATQTLVYRRLKTMRITLHGVRGLGVTAKDLVMEVIRRIGADGAVGHAVEFDGPALSALSVEERMTLANMIVEAGARGAVMTPDTKVFRYIEGRPRAPRGPLWDRALAAWTVLTSDPGARFDRSFALDVGEVAPMVTWGTSPDQAAPVARRIPAPEAEGDAARRRAAERALAYMDLRPGTPLDAIPISHAFIGSCTNARIEDLRDAARVLAGRSVAQGVRAIVVPGSTAVRAQAEAEGVASGASVRFRTGASWRDPRTTP